jgi:hypothetical protein
MSSFINCVVWLISEEDESKDYFYLVRDIRWRNSDNEDFDAHIPGTIAVPDTEIDNLHLLETVDLFGDIFKRNIPFIRRNGSRWIIDLRHYDSIGKS